MEAVTELKPLRRVCVKNLASENLFSLKELQSKGRDLDIKRKKSKKVPSGGQPYQLLTNRSQKIKLVTKKIKSVPNHRGDRHLQTATIVELQDQGALQLGNRRVDVPDATEKHTCPLLVQKIPVVSLKEQGLERISNSPYLRKAFEGSFGVKSHETKLEQQPGYAEAGLIVLTTQSLESCTLEGTEEASANKKQLSQKPSEEQESQEEEGPRKQHMGLGKRRSSGMYVLYNSSTASLVLEGVEDNGYLLPRRGAQHEMSCKRLASRKEAAQALGYLQGGSSPLQPSPAALTPDNDKHEDDSYPPPPPPPPSPFPLRDNDKPSPDVESPLFREDSALRASSEQGHRLD
ncbi:uncharacterized protein LOC141999843 [Natator depressus]|uniref:uncharacterized protein LOC141999843 n=1 Tax=Natator depressus TaxID=27790 RepID=UPI003EB9AA5E